MIKKQARLKNWSKPGPNFKGYKKFYDPKTKKPREYAFYYYVDERALKMIEKETEEGLVPGSGLEVHREATEKLIDRKFDPLAKLLEQYKEICDLIDKEGRSEAPRPNFMFQLHTSRMRILETLMPYMYGKPPVKTIASEGEVRDPITINLNLNSDPQED